MLVDVKEILEEYKDETERLFDVVAEDFQSQVEVLGEQYASIMDKLGEHDEKFEAVENSIDTVKLDLEFIKHGLQSKIDRRNLRFWKEGLV